jgi:hypothetical protein
MRLPRARRVSLALFLGAALSGAAGAQTPIPFPMDVVRNDGAFGSFEYEQRATELADLGGHSDIALLAVPLPDGRFVDLSLQRNVFDVEKVGVHVDGKAVGAWDPGDLSLWTGTVLGEERSEVTLGLASAGTYGWIRTQGEVWQVSSFVPDGGSWAAPRVRMWAESSFADLRDSRYAIYCMTDRMRANLGQLHQRVPASGGGVSNIGGGTVTLECRVAVETDYQYYQRFNNLNAAQNYMFQLLAAVSNRYRTEIDVVVTYPYLQFYTQNNDPWIAGDNPSQYDSGDLLSELRSAWQFNIPAGAHLGHIISGASLGGGVAWVDVLCNQNFGFAASTGISGGVNFPVSQGSGNWDFIVFSHEMGHQFGTGHTHDFCPTPLDRCAPSQYFGNCQTAQQCINTGTIMSYCHLCSGGTANITTYFHPTVKGVMRAGAESSCLAPYTGGPAVCFPDALEPNNTCATARSVAPGLFVNLEAANGDLDHYRITVPPNRQVTVDVLFTHANGDVDARLFAAGCGNLLASSTSSTNDEHLVWTNNGASSVDVIAQVVNFAGAGCFDYDLRVTVADDPCATTPDDQYEPNDTCAQAAPAPGGLQFGLFVSKTDPDHFLVNVGPGATITVNAYFSHALGDIDVYLYDRNLACGSAGNYLARGFSSTDDELVVWQNNTIVPIEVAVRIEVFSGSATNCNSYLLQIPAGQGNAPGTNFCGPAVLNSMGLPARISTLGSARVLDQDLSLVARDLPLFSNGYFIVSSNAGTVPNPGGSLGNLCLYPPYGRFIAQTQSSGISGLVTIPLDLQALPQPSGPVIVQPGQTWRFQYWYRDSLAGIPTSNFTDAVAVTFH